MTRQVKLFLGVLLFCCACTVSTVNEYYLIAYRPRIKSSLLGKKLKYPLPYVVEVHDLELNRVYDRVSIVVRKSLHKMTYSEKHKWAARPHQTVRELLISHINAYGMFNECRKVFLARRADFHITGRIDNIEKYDSPQFSFAFIDLSLYFRDKQQTLIFKHRIRREARMRNNSTAFFVKQVSDILKSEIGIFIGKMVKYFEQNPPR